MSNRCGSIDTTVERTGYLLWEGPSKLNGRDVACVVTFKSENDKTGPMPQVWILPIWERPNKAYWEQTADSYAICGNCKHSKLRSCYVQWEKAPRSVWTKLIAGGYPRATLRVWRYLRQRGVRMGSAGDPAALPVSIQRILRPATAYTHQWKQNKFQALKQYCMASCDSPEEREQARAKGWRVFEVGTAEQDMPKTAIYCPADIEGSNLQCAQCTLCAGTSRPAKDVFSRVHGKSASINNFTKWRKSPKLNVISG
jgi:hypothetical protein